MNEYKSVSFSRQCGSSKINAGEASHSSIDDKAQQETKIIIQFNLRKLMGANGEFNSIYVERETTTFCI